MKACPNIDQVHFRLEESLSRAEIESFFTSIRFNQLTWLTIDLIDLYDGANLVKVMHHEVRFLKGFFSKIFSLE